MITSISIENFKSISRIKLDCGALNVFTGINGSGKSTVLQTLLLLRQSFLAGSFLRKPEHLILSRKDDLVNLGTFKDIISIFAEKNAERIVLTIGFKNIDVEFTSVDYSPDNKDLNILTGNLSRSVEELEREPFFENRVQYLGAERIQPQEDYPRFQNIEWLGKSGEYTAHFLEKYGSRNISMSALGVKESQEPKTILSQVNDWMSKISQNVEIVTKENLNTNRIELSYRYKLQDGTPLQDQKPQNVGFGITHTLPIIVAILSAKKGDIILIENPETHLHPAAQAQLCELLSKAATNGIQLFVETHSDHIINGLRVAVKKESMLNSDLYLYYFTKQHSQTEIERIPVEKFGGIKYWPKNFFDQATKDLNYLFDI